MPKNLFKSKLAFGLTIENRNLLLIVLGGFILRLLVMPFTQMVDSDAVSRIYLAENWLDNPRLIHEGIWVPLHHYFNAFAIAITGEHVIGPKLLHILISCLTVIPLYRFTKREFSEKGAWFTAVLFILCPVVFRNSFMALSGLPHAFFVAMALNYISKSTRQESSTNAVWAGVCLTIACGFRYESWLLIPVFMLIYALFGKWKLSIYFAMLASVFPIFWMAGNYLEHGQLFYGIPGNYNYDVVLQQNLNVSSIDKMKRVLYFPFIWFFNYSPIIVFLLGGTIWKKLRNKSISKSRLIWSIPFWFFLFVFTYKALEGTLLMQNRFSILLILFSVPFAATIVENIDWTPFKKVGMGLLIATLLPFAYLWMHIPLEVPLKFSTSLKTTFGEFRAATVNTFKPIPQLWNQDYTAYSNYINQELSEDGGLILDFISWNSTYFMAYNSQLPQSQVLIAHDTDLGESEMNHIAGLIHQHPNGVILLKCHTQLSHKYRLQGNLLTLHTSTPISLQLTPIHKHNGIGIYQYEVTHSAVESNSTPCLECPEIGSREHFIFNVLHNEFWVNDTHRKAMLYGRSFDEQLELDTQNMMGE